MRPQHPTDLVDAHAHVFASTDLVPRVVDGLAPADRHEPADRLLATMSAHGVTSAVLVPLADEDEFVRSALTEHPGRFAAVVCATPRECGLAADVDPVAALRERRERMPFVALRSRWLAPPGVSVRESPMFRTLQAISAEGIALWSYLPPDQLPTLLELVRVLPELTVVLNHLGFAPNGMRIDEHRRPHFRHALPPERVDAVLAMSTAPNVHVMVSGLYALSSEPAPYCDLWPVVRSIRDAYGPSRLIWASDYPWPREVPVYGALLDSAAEALGDLTASEYQQVFATNARELLHLPRNAEGIPDLRQLE